MPEEELPLMIQIALIAIQIIAVFVFFYLIWPYLKKERWKEKFIDNKTARSIIIVLVMIWLFSWGLGLFFDTFFPVEVLQ